MKGIHGPIDEKVANPSYFGINQFFFLHHYTYKSSTDIFSLQSLSSPTTKVTATPAASSYLIRAKIARLSGLLVNYLIATTII
jgi:hypothetical protein